MFMMPVSGYIHVRAGGLGVTLGECQLLASVAKWTHIAGSHALLLAPASHVGVVLRHQRIPKDGLLLRMLPGCRLHRDLQHVVRDEGYPLARAATSTVTDMV
jgi:cytochrome b561